jgi:hypothetical protein
MTRLLPLAPIVAGLLLATPARAQEIEVELVTGGQEWVRRDGTVELVLSRFPAAGEGALAVVVGGLDRTDLFRRTERGLAYRPELMPLPAGESELLVYLVSADGEWRQIAQAPLRVLLPGGYRSASVAPRLDVGVTAQLGERHAPEENAPARPTFEDITFQLDLQGQLGREGWALAPQMNVVGVSFAEQALRFGTEGEEAPRADLASYSVALARGENALQLGHLSFGDHRFLMQGFESRGLRLAAPIGERVSIQAAAMNGTQIVGWDNFVGLAESRHRILSGTLGVELLPRAGGLRLDTTYLDGSLLPESGFNEGVVTDAETSTGVGLRLSGSTRGQRVRVDGGLARSRFDNPGDPFLSQGVELVEVEEEERGARYLDLSLGLLRRPIGEVVNATVDLALRHSRIDPLFRSVGAAVGADREENTAELTASIAGAAITLTHAGSEDNLDRVRTLPTTRNRRSAAVIAVPLGDVLARADGPRRFLPLLSWTGDRNHQYGLGLPDDGGFEAGGLGDSQIPDQVSTNRVVGLDWQAARWRLGVQLVGGEQDNRQLGRELADFRTTARVLTAGGTPVERLDLAIELGRERSENVELRTLETVERASLNLTLRPLDRLTVLAIATRTEGADRERTHQSDSWSGELQLLWTFERKLAAEHGVGGQLFVRWSDQASDFVDRAFGFSNETELATLTAGLNLHLF